MHITIDISPGELIDKITILRIKAERLSDPAQLANVRTELEGLEAKLREHMEPSHELDALAQALYTTNETLWLVQDEIRVLSLAGDHGPRFVACVQEVFSTNDHRVTLKRRIGQLFGSRLVEEKRYAG